MRVEIRRAALLGDKQNDTLLLGIFALALIGRHRVSLDGYPDILEDWEPTKSSRRLRDEVVLAIELSDEGDAKGVRALHTIIVDDVSAPNWSTIPVLGPEHALMLLARPFRVLLENGRNDGNFLLAHCSDADRQTLKVAERAGWLEWVDTSGITGLHAMINEDPSRGRRARPADEDSRIPESTLMRIFALCDSDAQRPGHISDQAAGVRTLMERHATKPFIQSTRFGHVLSARAAENYADPARVLDWARHEWKSHPSECAKLIATAGTPEGRTMLAGRPPPDNEQLLLRSLAWQRLRPEQRRHIHAKKGFGSPEHDSDLFADLEPFERSMFQHGFGDLLKHFYRKQRQHPDPTGEIPSIIRIILGRL